MYHSAAFSGWILALSVIFSGSTLANNTATQPQALINEIQTQIVNKNANLTLDWARLKEFYAPRGFYPGWVNHYGPLPKAEILRNALLTADEEGLEVKDYHSDKIALLWESRSHSDLTQLELLLSDAFFLYSVHLRDGQHRQNDFHWDIESPNMDPVAELRYLFTVNNIQPVLSDLAPSHTGYLRLRESLKRYRQIEEQGGWPLLPAGPILKPGDWHRHVIQLRKRLEAEGDLDLGFVTNPHYFDDALEFALERFQVRHGLKMDGILGPITRKVMNVSVKQRISQIKYNMERWRWLPRSLGDHYIMVNTAGYNLAVIKDENIQFTMAVIIGTPERPSPVIASKISTVVFNPYWTIPPTITFEDMLPKQRRNPSFFASKHIRVYRNGVEQDPLEIDWTKVDKDYFPYVLRQDPGPKNSLGRIKFLFNNSYTVYLHDTPQKSLFDKENRAFSSGCIRVEEPKQLASYLLGEDNGWTEEEVEEAIDSEEYREVPVSVRVPLYLVYMTAWVEKNGAVHFRPDVYNWDPNVSKCDAIR